MKTPPASSKVLKISPALWMLIAACTFFFIAGRAFIPHLGVQNDEALFASAFYEPRGGVYTVELLGERLTLMLMSYLGTLKGWMYGAIFQAARPSLFSIRTPVLLAGVATLWVIFKLLRRMSGTRAAVFGCVLLAADSMFLLTTTFDWGPVALQHLLLTAGLLLALIFYQDASDRALYGAFFLFGLGMWDKALMVWMLVGCTAGALAVFPVQVLRSFSWKRAALAGLAFLLGSMPLLIYNVTHEWDTFRGNSSFSFEDVPGKARLLMDSLRGQAMFGWMVAEDHETPAPHQPANALQRAAFGLSEAAGRPRHTLMLYALGAALLLVPLARGGELRALLFTFIAMAVGWLQMAITRNAGGSVHHAVLIWPFPHLLVATSFAAASRRLGRYGAPALAVVLVALTASNVLVLNQYYVQAIRNGGALNWNDAILPLNTYLRDHVRATNIFCVDWGILDSLRLLSRGRLPVRVGSDPVSKPELSEQERNYVRDWIKQPDHVFIAHSDGFEFFAGTNAKLLRIAAEMGYEREMMQEVSDRYGRKVFEVYRFRERQALARAAEAR